MLFILSYKVSAKVRNFTRVLHAILLLRSSRLLRRISAWSLILLIHLTWETHRPKESHTDQTNTSFQDASKDASTQLIPLQTKVGLGASLIYKSLSDAKLVHKKHMWSSDCWTQETKTLNPTKKKHVLIAGLDRYQRHKNHVHTNPPTHEKLTIWNIIFKKRSQRGFMLCLCTQH